MFDLSKRDKKFLAAGSVFLVLFSLVWFVYLPAADRKAALEKKIGSKTRDVAKMHSLEQTYQQYARSFDMEKGVLEKRGLKFSLFSFLDTLSARSQVKKKRGLYETFFPGH